MFRRNLFSLRTFTRAVPGMSLAFSLAAAAPAANIYVSPCGSDAWGGAGANCSATVPALRPKRTISSAIAISTNGDTVVVAPGVYNERIDFQGKKIQIVSTGAILSGSGLSGSIVTCTSDETSESVLDGFLIVDGTANLGGGIVIHFSSPTIRNCVFAANAATSGGAALINASTATFIGCRFVQNVADYGGAVAVATMLGLAPSFYACEFDHNSAKVSGGGLHIQNNSGDPIMVNCVIRGNDAVSHPGGLTGSAHLTNCTIVGNTSGNSHASGLSMAGGSVRNCIVWQNPSGNIEVTGSVTVQHCLIGGGYDGEGNIDADPLFVDYAAGNLRLSSDSPCIDQGNTTATPGGQWTDFYNSPRVLNDPAHLDGGVAFGGHTVDIGAAEHPPAPEPLSCPADVNRSTMVDIDDLFEVIGAWGVCPR